LDKVILTVEQPDRFERHCGVQDKDYRRQWVECSGCGAVNDVLPESSELGLARLRSEYYEVDLSGGDIAAKYRTVMALPPEQSDNAQRARRVDSFTAQWFAGVPGALKLLDIGAGTGVFLSRFIDISARKWDALAVEPDPRAAAHLGSLGKFGVRREMFSESLALREFSLVTLNKVVEHIEHPLPVLQAVEQSMSRRGIVYVEVPDKLTALMRPPTDNILGALHYHLYHPRSLSLLLERAGFEPLQIERVFEPSGKITVFAFACLPGALAGR
jgi:hypothetical protein